MTMNTKKMIPLALSVGIILGSVAPSALHAQSIDANGAIGGWSEKDGYFSITAVSSFIGIASTAKHTGYVEDVDRGNVLFSRAVGNTSWPGEYHYTRARFEGHITGNILGDSGRVWGTNATEAKSDWVDRYASDWVGKTYYGNE